MQIRKYRKSLESFNIDVHSLYENYIRDTSEALQTRSSSVALKNLFHVQQYEFALGSWVFAFNLTVLQPTYLAW